VNLFFPYGHFKLLGHLVSYRICIRWYIFSLTFRFNSIPGLEAYADNILHDFLLEPNGLSYLPSPHVHPLPPAGARVGGVRVGPPDRFLVAREEQSCLTMASR